MNRVTHEEQSKGRWNLGDVLPARSGKVFQTEILDRLEALLVEFENARPLLSASIPKDTFLGFLQNYEEIVRIRARLDSYAYMFFSEDTRSQEARTFKSRVEEIDADAANRTLFFESVVEVAERGKDRRAHFSGKEIRLLSEKIDPNKAVHSYRTSRTGDQPQGCDRPRHAVAVIPSDSRLAGLRRCNQRRNEETQRGAGQGPVSQQQKRRKGGCIPIYAFSLRAKLRRHRRDIQRLS